eukprot:TRINITY_DN5146_c0_g1_i8.p1 TRINITY_DN5146_c0_g1~~TRINITY_DN5146_c0_g1_i8.p1  ORF type:complete len:179 (+),score=25.62 TRINITY_DN5146_c0_g1_i8:201-737(+)
MGSSQSNVPDQVNQAEIKADTRKRKLTKRKSVPARPETFTDMCKLLGIKPSSTPRTENTDTPSTKLGSELPLSKKSSFQPSGTRPFASGLNLPKLNQLFAATRSSLSQFPSASHASKTNIVHTEKELPFILQSVKPWSSGVSASGGRTIHVRRLRPLEAILKRNSKRVPRMSEIVREK